MRKKNYYLLAIISGVLISIAIRYPLVPHEQGWDSFIIHQMAQSVSRYGYMKWILNPLSYIGYYPYSYASGIPVFLSSLSQVSGLDMEHTILLFCLVESILFFLFAYVAASLFTNRFIFKIFVAAAYSLSPGVIWFTDWTISTRGPFIMFLPLFIYLLFKVKDGLRINKKMLFLLSIIFFTEMAIHNMYIFLIPIALSYILSRFLFLMKTKTIRTKKSITSKFLHIFIPLIFLGSFMLLAYVPIFMNVGIQTYTHLDSQTLHEILIMYGAKIGIVFIFVPVGIFYLVSNKRKKVSDMFLMANALLIAPIILSPTYVSIGFLFVFLMLCSYFLAPAVKRNRKSLKYAKVKRAVIFALVILVVLWASQSKFHMISTKNEEKLDESYCEGPIYDTAITLKHMGSGGFVSNDWTIHGRISAYSERKNVVDYLYAINGYVNTSDMRIVTKKNIFDWVNDGPYVDSHKKHLDYIYWSSFRYMPRQSAVDELQNKYDIRFYIENTEIAGKINYYNKGIFPSPYFEKLDENQYTLYENEKMSIRYFG